MSLQFTSNTIQCSKYIQNFRNHSSFWSFLQALCHVNSWISTQNQLKILSNPHSHPPLLRCTLLLRQLVPGSAEMPHNSATCALIAVESQAVSVMHAFCAFLKGNAHCGAKHTDVTRGNERPLMHGTHTQRRKSEDDEELAHNHISKTILAIGDPSRNVIEKIFRSTTTDTAKYSINIKQVLKLNNSKETLERFEKFREEVKNRAYDQHNKDPRNIVDGNEKLMFYGTKLTCCKKFGASKLYKGNICSIIKPVFYDSKKKTGIWLTTNCQDIIIANANAEMMTGEMAIVVCRVISGRIMNDTDEDEYDSIAGVKPNYLFVKDPSAVLPCFVIILKCRYFRQQFV